MAIPADDLRLDMNGVSERLEGAGCPIKQRDEMLVVLDWKGMETTIYPQGKVMFFPLKDRSLCIKYAMEILGEVV